MISLTFNIFEPEPRNQNKNQQPIQKDKAIFWMSFHFLFLQLGHEIFALTNRSWNLKNSVISEFLLILFLIFRYLGSWHKFGNYRMIIKNCKTAERKSWRKSMVVQLSIQSLFIAWIVVICCPNNAVISRRIQQILFLFIISMWLPVHWLFISMLNTKATIQN